MSDETPNPGSEAGKVQPKKETVRINLPPKPTAAPTVRLPAPAAGGVAAPKAAAAAPAAKTAAAPAAKTAAAAAPAPAAAAPPAPAGAMPPRASAPARRAPQAAASPLDSILAVVAAIAGAATLVVTILMSMME